MSHAVKMMKHLMDRRIRNGRQLAARRWKRPEQYRPPATILNSIGDDWQCWRIAGETDRALAFRLQVHLQTLAIAIETDMQRVLEVEKEILKRSNGDE